LDSSRGPAFDGTLKPDLLAPGVNIESWQQPLDKNTQNDIRLLMLQEMPDDELNLYFKENPEIAEDLKINPGDDMPKIRNRLKVYYDYHYLISQSGTSFACPQVAGIAALLLEAKPDLTPSEIQYLLKETSTGMGSYFKHEQGAGKVNAKAAIDKLLADK